jgi:hypothetical protein
MLIPLIFCDCHDAILYRFANDARATGIVKEVQVDVRFLAVGPYKTYLRTSKELKILSILDSISGVLTTNSP